MISRSCGICFTSSLLGGVFIKGQQNLNHQYGFDGLCEKCYPAFAKKHFKTYSKNKYEKEKHERLLEQEKKKQEIPIEKKCKKCGKTKLLKEFYSHKQKTKNKNHRRSCLQKSLL